MDELLELLEAEGEYIHIDRIRYIIHEYEKSHT